MKRQSLIETLLLPIKYTTAHSTTYARSKNAGLYFLQLVYHHFFFLLELRVVTADAGVSFFGLFC